MSLLEVRDLRTRFFLDGGETRSAVEGVSFRLDEGETLGIVGESGCGKTMTALSVMGLVPRPGRVLAGSSIRWRGRELVGAGERELRRVRGSGIGMIFQEPTTSLNPVHPVGKQIREALTRHRGVSRREARDLALQLLEEVGISDPARRYGELPHRLSGGMQQRVMIAIALSGRPDLLIADEPTTALDVTIQAQILDLLAELGRRRGLAVVLISHDLGVIAEVCDRVAVMHEGRIVETGGVESIFASPRHPRTRALLESLPALARGAGAREGTAEASGADGSRAEAGGSPGDADGPDGIPDGAGGAEPLLRVRGLEKHFPVRSGILRRVHGRVRAVDGVSFDLHPGETLGLVGESGCGKTTTGRAALRLIEPTAGDVRFLGRDVRAMDERELRRLRRRVQIIFQDPASSLNPRLRAGRMLGEVLRVHGLGGDGPGRKRRIATLLERVGLPADHADRYPHQLSGGQRQRLGIARALAVEPELIVCDEPVSSLDAPIRARVVALLKELQADLGLAYLFIAHDLALVEEVSDRIAVMYLGRIVETGPASEVCRHPAHPYTRALLSAVPRADPAMRGTRRRIRLEGDVPSAIAPPAGCSFHPRCWLPEKDARCTAAVPPLDPVGNARRAACIKLQPDPGTDS